MVTYADSSFLVSTYIADLNMRAAHHFLQGNLHPIYLTSFSKSESQHAMRMPAFRGIVPHEVVTPGLRTFERDQEEGLYEMLPLAGEDAFQKASQLSHRHTLEFGVRYLDLLHIASALIVKAKRFLTFYVRPGKLAKAVGLEVKP